MVEKDEVPGPPIKSEKPPPAAMVFDMGKKESAKPPTVPSNKET